MGNKLRHEGDEVRIKVIWPDICMYIYIYIYWLTPDTFQVAELHLSQAHLCMS